jgi:hypothetical protein
MEKMNELISIQRRNACIWQDLIHNKYSTIEFLGKGSGQLPNYWVFGILSPDKINLLQHFRKKGFYASGVHLPNNFYSVFGKQKSLKGITEFHSKFLALPSGWWVKDLI